MAIQRLKSLWLKRLLAIALLLVVVCILTLSAFSTVSSLKEQGNPEHELTIRKETVLLWPLLPALLVLIGVLTCFVDPANPNRMSILKRLFVLAVQANAILILVIAILGSIIIPADPEKGLAWFIVSSCVYGVMEAGLAVFCLRILKREVFQNKVDWKTIPRVLICLCITFSAMLLFLLPLNVLSEPEGPKNRLVTGPMIVGAVIMFILYRNWRAVEPFIKNQKKKSRSALAMDRQENP